MAEFKKTDIQKAFSNYLENIQKTLAAGHSSEGAPVILSLTI